MHWIGWVWIVLLWRDRHSQRESVSNAWNRASSNFDEKKKWPHQKTMFAVTFAVNWEKSGGQFLISPLGPYLHPDRPKYAMIIVVSGPENMSIKKNFAINQKIKRGGVKSPKWSTLSVQHTWKSVHQKELCDHQEILNPPLGISNLWWPSTKMIIQLEWICLCISNPFEYKQKS